MFPRYSPLEAWEWRAVLNRHEAGDCGIDALLPGLWQLQLLARRSSFARRNRLFTPHTQTSMSQDGDMLRSQGAGRLEHRLYTLFAE